MKMLNYFSRRFLLALFGLVGSCMMLQMSDLSLAPFSALSKKKTLGGGGMTRIRKLRKGYYFLQHFCIQEGSLIVLTHKNHIQFPVANEGGWYTLNVKCVHPHDLSRLDKFQTDRVANVLPTTDHWGWHSLHGMVRATRVQLDHAFWYPSLPQRFTYYLDRPDVSREIHGTDWSNTFYPIVFGNEYYFSSLGSNTRRLGEEETHSNTSTQCYEYGYIGAPRMRTKNVDNQIKAKEFNVLIDKIQQDLNIRYDDNDARRPLVLMIERISSRTIINWQDVVHLTKTYLEPRNYTVQVIRWETMSILQQAELASQAIGMIGMHGNGLVWTMMMQRNKGVLFKLLPMYSHLGKTNMGKTGVNTDPNSNYGWIAEKRNVKRVVWRNTQKENHHCPKKNVDNPKQHEASWRECNTTVNLAEYQSQLNVFGKCLDQGVAFGSRHFV